MVAGTSRWVDGNTAFLIIHGVGEQNPLETLDSFATGIIPVINDRSGVMAKPTHHVAEIAGSTENYVSLTIESSDASIDLYEYYWAHETQREITAPEVLEWLLEVGAKSDKYYKDNVELANRYEPIDEAFGKRYVFWGPRRFKRYWYLRRVGLLMKIVHAGFSLLGPITSAFPAVEKPLKIVSKLVSRYIGKVMVDSFGDVVLYTSTDRKSKYSEVRRRILAGAVDRLNHLLRSSTPKGYSSVIIAGHSLGTVVGYDAINRVNLSMNIAAGDPVVAISRQDQERTAKKLKGFVTFGSPLDKVAFFFRARASSSRVIKRQIINTYHSFRGKDWMPASEPPPVELELDSALHKYFDDQVTWLNFWDPKDPIAGPLDFYWLDYSRGASQEWQDPELDSSSSFEGNRRLEMNRGWGVAHTAYWDWVEMYEAIVDEIVLA